MCRLRWIIPAIKPSLATRKNGMGYDYDFEKGTRRRWFCDEGDSNDTKIKQQRFEWNSMQTPHRTTNGVGREIRVILFLTLTTTAEHNFESLVLLCYGDAFAPLVAVAVTIFHCIVNVCHSKIKNEKRSKTLLLDSSSICIFIRKKNWRKNWKIKRIPPNKYSADLIESIETTSKREKCFFVRWCWSCFIAQSNFQLKKKKNFKFHLRSIALNLASNEWTLNERSTVGAGHIPWMLAWQLLKCSTAISR